MLDYVLSKLIELYSIRLILQREILQWACRENHPSTLLLTLKLQIVLDMPSLKREHVMIIKLGSACQ